MCRYGVPFLLQMKSKMIIVCVLVKIKRKKKWLGMRQRRKLSVMEMDKSCPNAYPLVVDNGGPLVNILPSKPSSKFYADTFFLLLLSFSTMILDLPHPFPTLCAYFSIPGHTLLFFKFQSQI